MKYGRLQAGDIPLFHRTTRNHVLGFNEYFKCKYQPKAANLLQREIIRDLDELWGRDQKEYKQNVNHRYFERKFLKKGGDYKRNKTNNDKFGESEIIDTEKDKQTWDDAKDSDDGLDDYMNGRIKINY